MSYREVGGHAAMMFDDRRNGLYAEAIRRHVRPGSIVIDLGAGLGLHGLVAARAGAARAYLVEPEPVVQLALEAARALGLQDRIVIVPSRVEDMPPLPQPADLIVSVFTGNLLFSEDLLPSLFHARDRHLAPGGKLVPEQAQLWLAPVQAPRLHDKHVARWSRPVQGIDFSHARLNAANEILWVPRPGWDDVLMLAEGGAVADIDLYTATRADCDGRIGMTVEARGDCHAIAAWIRLRVGADDWLSSAPGSPDVHWTPALLPVDPPLPLAEGETVSITLARPAFGDWTWAVTARAGTRRHSTFLSQTDGLRELARTALGNCPGLSPRGERARQVLQGFADGLSNGSIADRLADGSPEDRARWLREVQALALRYGAGS